MAGRSRTALLDELIDLYLAEGFLKFGVGELAERLHCSRTTLYGIASSKEQMILSAISGYFNRAGTRINRLVEAEPDLLARVATYLKGVSNELAPASPAFYADLARFEPAAALYREHTRLAAQRFQRIVDDGVAAGAVRDIDSAFAGAAVAELMSAIQTGRLRAASGLDDAAAYAALADLVSASLRR